MKDDTEKDKLIIELFELWKHLYEKGEIYSGVDYAKNYKRLNDKVNKYKL